MSDQGRKITTTQAINEALHLAMSHDPHMLCFGLGVGDPKEIFGTTAGLQEKFGRARVFDTPTSENALTGIGIGASFNGVRSVMIHQRLDFFLLAMDQLVNSAAKWHYMYGGQRPVPITIRLIIGHGWGQGPTHAQNLQAWFAHIPGLKVVMPSSAYDSKGLLLSSIYDDNPVVFLEHRWIHNLQSHVPEGDYRLPLGKAKVVREGKQVTIVGLSYMTIEAIHAVDYLAEQGVECELIDLMSVQPLDVETIYKSVRKTGRLLALDTAQGTCSVAADITARVSQDLFKELKTAPRMLTQPHVPSPASFGLTKNFYKRSEHIVDAVSEMLNLKIPSAPLAAMRNVPHDVPGDWFRGPF